MYAYLTGHVLMIDGITLTLLIEWSGIGYDIYASPSVLGNARMNNTLSVWIHHHRTEVSESLFGFDSFDERALFRELNKVNGVGGKTALALLGLGREELIKAIQFEDDKLLSSVPGIGKKTAQKIIVDLKWSIDLSKKSQSDEKWKSKHPSDTLVVSSLVQMGYDKTRVEEIIETLQSDLPLAEKVKEAIKKLN